MPSASNQSHRGRLRPLVLLIPLLAGCAAFRNDLDGLPARYLPEEYRVASERGKQPINPALLGQAPPAEYRVDTGDILSIYVDGVLGRAPELAPVQTGNAPFDRPTTGYPIAVRDDGTIALPYEGSIDVRDLSLREVERKVRDFYTYQRPLLREGRSRVLVGLHRPRTFRILVVRQESGNRQGNIGSGGTVNFEIDKRGTGRIVELPAYQNDVLHALSSTGGLPGVDARNAVYVVRRPRCRVAAPPQPAPRPLGPPQSMPAESWSPQPEIGPSELQPTVEWRPLAATTAPSSRTVVRGQSPDRGRVTRATFETTDPHRRRVVPLRGRYPQPVMTPPVSPPHLYDESGLLATLSDGFPAEPVHGEDESYGHVPYVLDDATIANERVLKIPLRLHPGEPAPFRPEDVVLHDGDVVFIESRQTEFFYTAGLLGGGQYPIPRDFDLNVLEALALVDRLGSGRNRLERQISGPAATGLDVSSSASELIVLRTLPDGREVPIKVDLYRAMTDPTERILVAPGDYLFLKYTKSEAVGAWIERWLFDNVANGVNGSPIVTGGQN